MLIPVRWISHCTADPCPSGSYPCPAVNAASTAAFTAVRFACARCDRRSMSPCAVGRRLALAGHDVVALTSRPLDAVPAPLFPCRLVRADLPDKASAQAAITGTVATYNVGATAASVAEILAVAEEVTGRPIPVTRNPRRNEPQVLV